MSDPTFQIKTEEQTGSYGRFIIEPLPTGFAHTLGNALRRVLLSSLSGSAVVSVTIDGVSHPFQTLEGLEQDIVQLVLNLKKLQVRLTDGEEATLTISATGPGDVTGSDIKCPSNVEIMNPELYLGTLSDKKGKLTAKITVGKGFGYSVAEERKTDIIGLIPLDATYSPVVRVNYRPEATRVGRQTDFDRLVMEIWTNGTVSPIDAMKQSAKILVTYFQQVVDPKAEGEEVSVISSSSVSDEVARMLVEELDLPTRLENALKNGNIETVGQLLGTPRKELMKIKNLGGKSLSIVEDKLQEKGVTLSI